MKVYLILVQASYDDGFSIHSILNDEVKAIAKAKNLNENKKSSYDEYWVEEWNVET
jgi:hypothetical protein